MAPSFALRLPAGAALRASAREAVRRSAPSSAHTHHPFVEQSRAEGPQARLRAHARESLSRRIPAPALEATQKDGGPRPPAARRLRAGEDGQTSKPRPAMSEANGGPGKT